MSRNSVPFGTGAISFQVVFMLGERLQISWCWFSLSPRHASREMKMKIIFDKKSGEGRAVEPTDW